MMNDNGIFDKIAFTDLSNPFRVIGIGEATKDIIEEVKSYEYDGVEASVVTEPSECLPMDEDRMVIIVAKDRENQANNIAKIFHNAGVLTLGFLDNANPDCFDCVVSEATCPEYSGMIKEILQPIATHGIVDYGLCDLKSTLAGSKHFFITTATGHGTERVADAIDHIKSVLASHRSERIERISIFLYFKRDDTQKLVIRELTALSDFLSESGENVDIIWATYPDETIKDHEIKISMIAAVPYSPGA